MASDSSSYMLDNNLGLDNARVRIFNKSCRLDELHGWIWHLSGCF